MCVDMIVFGTKCWWQQLRTTRQRWFHLLFPTRQRSIASGSFLDQPAGSVSCYGVAHEVRGSQPRGSELVIASQTSQFCIEAMYCWKHCTDCAFALYWHNVSRLGSEFWLFCDCCCLLEQCWICRAALPVALMRSKPSKSRISLVQFTFRIAF